MTSHPALGDSPETWEKEISGEWGRLEPGRSGRGGGRLAVARQAGQGVESPQPRGGGARGASHERHRCRVWGSPYLRHSAKDKTPPPRSPLLAMLGRAEAVNVRKP